MKASLCIGRGKGLPGHTGESEWVPVNHPIPPIRRHEGRLQLSFLANAQRWCKIARMPSRGFRAEPEHPYAQLRNELAPHLAKFTCCRSTAELRRLACYRESSAHIHKMLATLDSGDFRAAVAPAQTGYRVVAWNIERGAQLAGQLEAWRADERLKNADVILVTEADIGMARSGNANVARTMARELGLCYAFAPCYFSLVKGSGVERAVEGENEVGLHGNAVLSRHPIRRAYRIPLANGVDKMRGREKRLGTQAAIAAEIDLPGCALTAVAAHLDMQSSQRHRRQQMRAILDALPGSGPAIIGGDWNTSTYDTSHVLFSSVGFWRRVLLIGTDNAIRNHYLHPERWFDRGLFRLLESRGFEYRACNLMGERTVHYDMACPRALGSLGEWVPAWGFRFIRWVLRNYGGKCPFKLDWFATRGLNAVNPFVIHDYPQLSDHDPIRVEVSLPPGVTQTRGCLPAL